MLIAGTGLLTEISPSVRAGASRLARQRQSVAPLALNGALSGAMDKSTSNLGFGPVVVSFYIIIIRK